jgi:hypothetical protein
MHAMNASNDLPPVPDVTIGTGGAPALFAVAVEAAQAQIDDANRRFTRVGVALADARSKAWLERACNPFLDEIDAVARAAGRPGAWLLNCSYEWGCTSAVTPDPNGQGMRLLRTLDWPFHGLGRALMGARMTGQAGDWFNITWPGFAGVLTANCPGRFAVAFNQTPMFARRWGPIPSPMPLDWILNRIAMGKRRALPPAHLLRQVCDEANDYAEAKSRVCETRLAASCFVTLAGLEPGEGCVIERHPNGAIVHETPAAITNHWLTDGLTGHARTRDTQSRLARMQDVMTTARDLDWVAAPILNSHTRLAAEMNPATGQSLVQGYEKDGAVSSATPFA